MRVAVSESSPLPLLALKAAREPGTLSVLSINPDSRSGRRVSPHVQDREPMENTRFVGIDISKDQLDVCVRPDGEVLVLARDGDGIKALIERLRSLTPQIVVLEATGGFEAPVAAALADAGIAVAVVNPRQIRDFARATGRLAKTDELDAAAIAHFAEAIKPEVRPLLDEQAREFKALMARRREIVDMIVRERNRLGQAVAKRVVKDIKAHLRFLAHRLEGIDEDIDGAVRGSPIWRAKEDLLRSVPGVGPQTARTLLAEMPELGALSRRKVASLAGLAPMNRDSGAWRGKRTIQGGRRSVRAILYMAALVASRRNPVFKTYYQHLIANGKAKKLAILAIARKLLVALNAILRDNTPWQNA